MNDPERTGAYQPEEAPTLAAAHAAVAADHPQQIGRYRVEKVLGEGGFGRVYLAHDDQLQRLVAVKVSHRERIDKQEDAGAYLAEARILASLDHPHIVPVHDVGRSDDGLCFVVSKLIDGNDLATIVKETRLSDTKSAELVAAVAEALHHAHKRGLVHRDVKPGNILIDKSGIPYLADFGLALKDEDYGKGGGVCGTPAYMSPEQANGEGHRVDGRSDLFSLGVVFYELLTGRRPFRGDTAEVLIQIAADEPRPPRQIDDAIPKELERICLKAMSKRALDRYTTARDMADDLRHFLRVEGGGWRVEGQVRVEGDQWKVEGKSDHTTPHPPHSTHHAPPVTPSSDQRPIKIVPKGLRSFDAHDSDFFLELLPGPRDRDGLPDSIRFWKIRIEEKDADNTITVGLIYGPSGCGKSSLVKAGLLPRLSEDVVAVYVEATAEETETRLLNGLRKSCPDLPDNLGLKETLAALRRGQGIPAGKKVLIVLDQFEQWLHAPPHPALSPGGRGLAEPPHPALSPGGRGLGEGENTELVQALRQCEGGRVQCIVMVRDDFWMAATRFMRELEVRLVEAQNSAAVDLFPMRHAEKVLAAFGRAFGALPDASTDVSADQKRFLEQAVSGLALEGKVICVRLALFAEMMKGKAWTLATLKEVGGTEGIGVTFLEETFSAATAPPEHRYHQQAARSVLRALLPESGSDIKGHMRSYAELLEASGYGSRPNDFDDLIRILDSEIRLITPTDPAGTEQASAAQASGGRQPPVDSSQQGADAPRSPMSTRFYQLTHDYLVPSLRDWLTRKQKETRRGRAELLLADRAAVWNARPQTRHLPPWWEWPWLRLMTRKKNWTEPERRMMRGAARHWTFSGLVAAAVWALVIWAIYEGHGRLQANNLRDRLLDANTSDVPGIVKDMAPYRRWLDPFLHEAYDKAAVDKDPRKQLHASLALLPVDGTQVTYIYQRLLDAEPGEMPVLRDALAPYREELLDRLWAAVETPEKGKQRLRAAAALAKYDPECMRWDTAGALVVNDLVLENPVYLGQWSQAFHPVNHWLVPRLSEIFRKHEPERAVERNLATSLLADYAADQTHELAELLMDADEKQFAVLYPKFEVHGAQGASLLTDEIDKRLPPDLPSSDVLRERLAKRQANSAVALLRMKQPAKVWPLLKHGPDPRVRSYLIHRFAPLGADARAIVRQMEKDPDQTIRRALILSLGEYGEQKLSPADRKELLPKLHEIYCNAADPGLHAASEWLLRHWEDEEWLKQQNEKWAKDRELQVKASRGALAPGAKPQWYVNGQGQTMVVLPASEPFMMGSPPTEVGRGGYEPQHERRIGRTFAIAAMPVTVEQFLRFRKYHFVFKEVAPTPDCPVNGVTWYDAAAYCNWLSKQEGIPENQWCYVPHDESALLIATGMGLACSSQNRMLAVWLAARALSPDKDAYAEGMKLAPDYLKRTGYRLSSETEWEYACRAKSLTSRYYGETEELLGKYAWYIKNSQERTRPVGSLKPNDFGLFDMQGNVEVWCQERYKVYPTPKDDEASEDKEDALVVNSTASRVLRGGTSGSQASFIRSADRNNFAPTDRFSGVGFRPARTITVAIEGAR